MREASKLPKPLPVRGSHFGAVVVAVKLSWREALPRTLAVDDEEEDLYDEEPVAVPRGKEHDPVWKIGDCEALTLRRENRLWVVQHVVTTAQGAVVVVYTPRDCPRALEVLRRLPQRGRWPVVVAADGTYTIPALQSDSGAVATAVKAAWPVSWRRRQVRDTEGDPINGVPAASPTGTVILGSALV